MKKFIVPIIVTQGGHFIVEACSQEEARKIATQMYLSYELDKVVELGDQYIELCDNEIVPLE